MKHKRFECDQCGGQDLRPSIILKGQWSSAKGGILLPRFTFHFCSKGCLEKWLKDAEVHGTL